MGCLQQLNGFVNVMCYLGQTLYTDFALNRQPDGTTFADAIGNITSWSSSGASLVSISSSSTARSLVPLPESQSDGFNKIERAFLLTSIFLEGLDLQYTSTETSQSDGFAYSMRILLGEGSSTLSAAVAHTPRSDM